MSDSSNRTAPSRLPDPWTLLARTNPPIDISAGLVPKSQIDISGGLVPNAKQPLRIISSEPVDDGKLRIVSSEPVDGLRVVDSQPVNQPDNPAQHGFWKSFFTSLGLPT